MSDLHIVKRPITTLQEALDFIRPSPASKGAIVFQALKLRQASEIIEAEIARLPKDYQQLILSEERE